MVADGEGKRPGAYNEVLTGYAYETVAKQAITAGQGTTPEPGTLGLLALGSLGQDSGGDEKQLAASSRLSAVIIVKYW
jgi:hypothetical protein